MIVTNLMGTKKERRKAFPVLWAASLALLMQTQPLCAMDKPLIKSEKATVERLRNHNYYKEELRKLEESTKRIHAEVDRILKEFRRNMEEYYNRTRGGRGFVKQGYQFIQIPIKTIAVDTCGVYDLQGLQKKVAQAGADSYGRGKVMIRNTPEKGAFGVVYLDDAPYALKVSNGQSLKSDRARELGLEPDELDQFSKIGKILSPKKDRLNLKICLPQTTMLVELKNTHSFSFNSSISNVQYWDIKSPWNIQIMEKLTPQKKMEEIIVSAANRNQGALDLINKLGKDLGQFQNSFLEKNYFDGKYKYNTMVHGDLSLNNILYNGCFNVIDNASMGNGRPILTDPMCLIYSSVRLIKSINEDNKRSLLEAFYSGYMFPFDPQVRAEVKRCFRENIVHQYALRGTPFDNLQLNIQYNLPEYVREPNPLYDNIVYKNLYNSYFQKGNYEKLYNNTYNVNLYDDFVPLHAGHYLRLYEGFDLSLHNLDPFVKIEKEVIEAI